MTISYPESADDFVNPLASQDLDSPDHATQHSDANDAIEALQTVVGVRTAYLARWARADAYEWSGAITYTGSQPTSGSVTWPDGSGGTFSGTHNATWDALDAFTITHDDSGLTVTQPTVTRDSNGNATTIPALTVA